MLNYNYYYLLFISLFFLFISCKKDYSIESGNATGLTTSGYNYSTFVLDNTGSIYLFASKIVPQIKPNDHIMRLYRSKDNGSNWECVYETKDVYFDYTTKSYFNKGKIYLTVGKIANIKKGIKTDNAEYFDVRYVMSYDIGKGEALFSDSIQKLMPDLDFIDGKLIGSTNDKFLFFSDSLQIENKIDKHFLGTAKYIFFDNQIWSYCLYNNELHELYSGKKYELPFNISDAVIIDREKVLFTYSVPISHHDTTISENEDEDIAILDLKDFSFVENSGIKGYRKINKMITNGDSLIIASTKSTFSLSQISYSKDNGRNWQTLNIDGVVVEPYCLKGDTLIVLSRSYFSKMPKIYKVTFY